MNRIQFIVFLTFACCVLAADSNLVAANWLINGSYDIAKVDGEGKHVISSRDSTSGIFLHVEQSCDDPYVDSYGVYHDYLKFFLEKKMGNATNDRIWVFTGSFNKDSINSELKKGYSLSLEKFTELTFDSSQTKYLVESYRPGDAEINTMIDSNKGIFYILYQRMNSVAVFCGIAERGCYYQIGCFYNNDGLFVFDSIPDPERMIHALGCILCSEQRNDFIPANRSTYKINYFDCPLYKVNGVPAAKASSNIVIQNNQSKLRLKGK